VPGSAYAGRPATTTLAAVAMSAAAAAIAALGVVVCYSTYGAQVTPGDSDALVVYLVIALAVLLATGAGTWALAAWARRALARASGARPAAMTLSGTLALCGGGLLGSYIQLPAGGLPGPGWAVDVTIGLLLSIELMLVVAVVLLALPSAAAFAEPDTSVHNG
jgi:hypothetical protein